MTESDDQSVPSESAAETDDGQTRYQMPNLDERSESSQRRDFNAVLSVPVTLSVELGSTRMTIAELLELANGSIVELDGYAGEPMKILVNGTEIAKGEVVTVDDKYAVRITSITDRSGRMESIR